MNKNCKKIDTCIACGKDDLKLVLDLGIQPLANSFKNTAAEEEDKYPLILNWCPMCSHMQLSHMVHPDKLFKHYLYVSGTSVTQLNYFKWFAEMVQSKVKLGNILDVGCNDGSQLDVFKLNGFNTYGIDPAKNLHPISSNNHTVICDYFNNDVEFSCSFDAIVCQNAFAHNYDQLGFLTKCKRILSNTGLIFISISQANMIENNEFDTIYHEHYSYYTVKSIDALCVRAGVVLVDVIKHPIHGNSYIFVISKNNNRSNIVDEIIAHEDAIGLSDESTYKTYADSAERIANEFKNIVDDIKSDGCIIAGYGSAAKGNTMLNFSKTTLDFIIDDNPLKQGMFTPGSSIPIFNIKKLEEYKSHEKLCFIPLAWNFFEEIYKRIKSVRIDKNDIYLKYFPQIEVLKENGNNPKQTEL
jgi:2-polyprenyl-3-methyl-5-hydroxy-6-metoxy-1,4-benzoquinol methylase